MQTYTFSLDEIPASAIARLRLFLRTNRLPPPAAQALVEEIYEWFGTPAFSFASALRGEGAIPDWHLIRLEPTGNPFQHNFDPLTLAPSLSTALAALLAELDATSIFPDTVAVTSERLTFRDARGTRLASIEPIAVSAPDSHARHRVEELLKGVRAFDSPARLSKRLSSLPGLENLYSEPRQCIATPSPVVNLSPDNLAGQLRAMLAERFSISLKQHQAQEALAALFGFADWQHLLVRRDDVWTRLQPTAVCLHADRVPLEMEVTLHPSPAEAIAAFARCCQRLGSPLHFRQSTGTYGSRQDLELRAYPLELAPLVAERSTELTDAASLQRPAVVDSLSPEYLPLLVALVKEHGLNFLYAYDRRIAAIEAGIVEPLLYCSLLELCEASPPYAALANSYLEDPTRTEALLQAHFGVGSHLVDRYRLVNRRQGISPQEELFMEPWLIGRRPSKSSERTLTFSIISPDHPPRSHHLLAHKAVLTRAEDGWHLLNEYGHEDLGPLAGLSNDAAERIAKRFEIEIRRSRDAF